MSGARLGKLIRLLSSNQPGEVVAAAGTINRALKSAGIGNTSWPRWWKPRSMPRWLPGSRYRSGQRILQRHGRPRPGRRRRRPFTLVHHFRWTRIICDAPDGLFRQCRCGSTRFTVMAGVSRMWRSCAVISAKPAGGGLVVSILGA